jgi:hypothetical protein
MDAKKLKLIVRGDKKPTFGTDPNEPWSVRAGITESEAGMLHAYLRSRGINPQFVGKDTKISHSKSSEFQKWKRDHMFDDPADYVSSVAREKIKSQRAQAEEVEIEEGKTLQHTPVELRQHALNREKHMTKVLKHNGLHKEEHLDEVSPETLTSYILKTSGKDPKRADARKKATSKLAKIMAKKPVDKNAPRYLPMGEEKKPKMTALDKFRKAAAEREKKHSQYEKPTGDMKGAIDRLEKHLNKEAADAGVSKAKETKFHTSLDKLVHKTFGPSPSEKKEKQKMKKEEVEQIDEISKSTLDSYKDKSSASLKTAQTNRDAAEPGKNMSKGFADLHAKSNAIAKKRVKGLMGYLQRKQGVKPMGEDVFQDTQAATQTAFDMGTQADDREPTYSKKKEMSKSARMIKALYKKHKMVKEELYDHEKEDKSVATYGKKPKVEKQEVYGDEDNQAAMVLKGGTTLTGQTRDTLEIDPVMRKANKNNNNQTDK